MRPHSWIRRPDLDTADDARRHGGPKPESIFWVSCTGCGGLVMADRRDFPDACHEGWRMPADCDVTVVEQIMEE